MLDLLRSTRLFFLCLACLMLLAPISVAQNEEEEPEDPNADWEFVPGRAADAAAGLLDESFQDEIPPEVVGAFSAEGSDEISGDFGFNPQGVFMDTVDVRLVPLAFRILDPWARPIPDLGPEDLEAVIGEVAVPVAAVDWYGTYQAPEVWEDEVDPATRDQEEFDHDEPVQNASGEAWPDAAEPLLPAEDARHLVIFMQIGEHDNVGLERALIWGHLKVLPGLERLLRGLGPSDRVALVSHGAHMVLWHDFTTDHQAIHNLLFDTVGYGKSYEPPRAKEGPSLARALEFYDIDNVTNTAGALRALADAMAGISGIKDVIYVGWSFAGPHDHIQHALRTFVEYETVVSVLVSAQTDVPRGGTLKALAQYTGGTIQGTRQFASRSVDRLTRSLSGHYIVSLDLSGMNDLEGELVLRVKDREAKIISRSYVF